MKRLLPAMMLRSNFMAASAASGAPKVTMAAPAIEVSGKSLVQSMPYKSCICSCSIWMYLVDVKAFFKET